MGYEPWDNERLDKILASKSGWGCKIIRLGEVIGIRYKIRAKCITHDYEWDTTPQTLAAINMCPVGAIEYKKGRHRKAKYKYSEVKEIVESNGYKLLSTEYLNNKAPITFMDEENGTTITTTFRNFLATYYKKGVDSKNDQPPEEK